MGTITITDDGKEKTSEMLERARKLFAVWSPCNDGELDRSCPPPKTPTTRTFLKTREPDKATRGKSYDEAVTSDSMTLRERILMEIVYFEETGEHLDIVGWTITSSLASARTAVFACWSPDARGFRVHGYNRSGSHPSDGPRQAVFPSDLETRVASLEATVKKLTTIINL